MKKVLIGILVIAVAAAAVFAAYSFIGGKEKDKSNIVLTQDSVSEDVIDKYAAMVNNLKAKQDFTATVTTRVRSDGIDCSVSIFSAIISKFIDFDESSSDSYTFLEGVAGEDSTLTPNALIPPGSSEIQDIDYSAVLSTAVNELESAQSLTLTIAEEDVNLEAIMESNDLSGLELPKHMQFVSADDMLSQVSKVLGGEDGSMLSFGTDETDGTYGTPTFDMDKSYATVGATDITATYRDNSALQQIQIEMPLTIHMDLELMGKEITLDIKIMLEKQYEFIYNAE